MNDKKDDATISLASNVTEAAPAETAQLTMTLTQDSLSPESGGASLVFDTRFKIERELGRGGIGVTYLATDLHNGNPVAIKSLLERLNAKDTAWVERHFRDEVAALSRIKHSGVVKFVASGLTPDGKPYIAMEYVEGVDLRSLIEPEKGVDDFERIANLMQQLGEAISAAHEAGVYHRDLKPENVLITKPTANRNEEVKVIDFGIATVKNSVDEKTRATVLAGSVRYMAPEQLYGKPSLTSDIYAMGVLSYEMITGRAPFNPDLKHPLAAMQQLLQMQKNGVRVKPQDLRPSLPDEAQAVILKALSFTPADRYQRADEFGKALAEALTGHDEDKLTTQYIDKGTQVMTDPAVTPLSKPEQQTKVDGGRKTNVGRVALESDKTPTLVEEKAIKIESKPETPQPPNTRIIKIAAVAIGIAFLAVALLLIFRDRNKNEVPPIQPVSPAAKNSLSYWAEAQTYEKHKKVGEPIRLFGPETYFRDGDVIRFLFTSLGEGYIYVLYENTSQTKTSYAFLFPSPKAPNPLLRANEVVSTAENEFDNKKGVEKVWLIWSAQNIPVLQDAANRWVNPKDEGIIKDTAQTETIKDLIRKYSNATYDISLNEAKQWMDIKSSSDVIVRLLPLQHR